MNRLYPDEAQLPGVEGDSPFSPLKRSSRRLIELTRQDRVKITESVQSTIRSCLRSKQQKFKTPAGTGPSDVKEYLPDRDIGILQSLSSANERIADQHNW
jgi:hypothetical protein